MYADIIKLAVSNQRIYAHINFPSSSCFKVLVSYDHSAATDSMNHTQEAQDHPSNLRHRHSMTYHSDPKPHIEQLCYHLAPQHLYLHESDFHN
jgi:hypothetical protein